MNLAQRWDDLIKCTHLKRRSLQVELASKLTAGVKLL